MFLAKRTPPRSSSGLWPWPSSSSGGCTDTRRDLPSAKASRAAFKTAARAQPPPIQPSEIVPSGRITAFAPALAAVAATVRTTVASANGSPLAFMAETRSRISPARSVTDLSVVPAQAGTHEHRHRKFSCADGYGSPPPRGRQQPHSAQWASDSREIRLERREALEIVGGREQVDVRQRGAHAARRRLIIAPADERIEPDDAAAAAAQAPHLGGEALRFAGVVAVGDDHDCGARIDDAGRVPAIERGEAVADARAAANALRHQRQPVDRARHVAVAQPGRDMRQPGVEHERLRLAEGIDHAVQEAD